MECKTISLPRWALEIRPTTLQSTILHLPHFQATQKQKEIPSKTTGPESGSVMIQKRKYKQTLWLQVQSQTIRKSKICMSTNTMPCCRNWLWTTAAQKDRQKWIKTFCPWSSPYSSCGTSFATYDSSAACFLFQCKVRKWLLQWDKKQSNEGFWNTRKSLQKLPSGQS